MGLGLSDIVGWAVERYWSTSLHNPVSWPSIVLPVKSFYVSSKQFGPKHSARPYKTLGDFEVISVLNLFTDKKESSVGGGGGGGVRSAVQVGYASGGDTSRGGHKTEGGARSVGGAGAARRRWVPPSARAEPEAHHDLVFRKVRGILNKLTPDKFRKLSDALLALDLSSDKVLKGVIILVFDKALDEPKYSSMYAQLCKRLSEEAPNSEPPGQPCTFKVLLLNKCRDEFENRAQAFAAYERGGAALSPEDEERRHIAKCKMLGNIKFIGELGKLEILSEAILHRCIQALLARRAGGEAADDLECLAQLVRTCGRVLDSARGRGLMEQYFARISALSEARHLAPRIRFMLRDTVELRRGGWVPRAAAASDPPVPIHQLRPEDSSPQAPPQQDPLFRRARPLDDVLAGLAMSSPDHPTPPDKLFGNGFNSRNRNNAPSQFGRRERDGGRDGFRDGKGAGNKDAGPRPARSRLAPAPLLADVQMRPAANSLLFTANKLSNKQPQSMPLQPVQQSMMNSGGFSSGGAPLVKEPAITIKPATDKKDKPKKEKGMSKEEAVAAGALAAAGACAGSHEEALEALQPLPDKLLRRALAAALLHCFHHQHEEEGEGEAEKANGVSDAEAPGSEREHAVEAEVREAGGEALDAENGGAGEGQDDGGCVEAEDAAAAARLTQGAGAARLACARGVVALVRTARRGPLADTVRALLARHPHPALPHLLAQAVLQKVITVSELGAWAAEGGQWELVLDVLELARAALGLRALAALLEEARSPLAALLRAAGASDSEAAAATRARQLHDLAPVLHLQAELSRCLEGCGSGSGEGEGGEGGVEASPAALWRWVRGLEAAARAHPAFVGALVQHVGAHVTARAGTDVPAPPRAALDREAALVEAFAPLLCALTRTRPDAQLAAVYALQLHAHTLRYPRGLLLRWFMYLYNLEVCEEDAFLRWREDVTDEYPGKGEALFQVNAWLTWLQQQESEEEDGED